MYQIRCDDYILYDPRDEELIVLNPKCKLKENTVGEGSFTILPTHPYYGSLQKLKSIFEVQQDGKPIFRGRMTRDSRDFHNQFFVDLEGVLGFTNDTLIPPFNFPDDFPGASTASNVVEYFLGWILDQHNSRCEDWQKLKLGKVTVSDPNNYITRSSEKYASTWETLKSKLFDSALGGYLYARYEEDGNYVDYVGSYELTNTQRITFGENLLNITNESDASETYSAILPIGKDGLTIAELADGALNDDLVKDGLYIYSKSGREAFGWVCVPVNESTWSDVTDATNLRSKASSYLSGTAMKLSATITIKAVDLHFTDEEIQSFRVYRNILVDSPVHGVNGESYRLSELDIDIMNPQNTIITIGDSSRTLVDINADRDNNVDVKIESTKNELKDFVSSTTSDLEHRLDGIDGTYFYIRYSPYSDGHVMTSEPDSNTKYMGTCSTNEATAPTDYRKYTWCLVRGADGQDGSDGKDGKDGENGTPGNPGKDGKTQYLHIKYSDDGETFTANNGEELGAYIGTLVDFTEADSMVFSDYTWKKFTEDVDGELENIHKTMGEQYTAVLNDAEKIIMTALERYVETSNYKEFRQTTESTLQQMANLISLNFTKTTEQITNVDGDLQSIVEELEKHFEFGLDGLTIKGSENSMSLLIDNDLIRFMKNGEQFGWWDGINFHTGNIVVKVNERAQFGNFAFVPRSNGSLSFLKVGGDEFAKRLLGITATYTGGEVLAGTSISALTGITVTATYSDNTIETVTGYTLSGSIQEGENVITATYSGKTSRFVVVGYVEKNPDVGLGSGTSVSVYAWSTSTSTGGTVYYSDTTDVVDGAVVLVNQKSTTFYQTTSGKTNNYDVLLGKYVKAFNGGIYYIDPDAEYSHSTGGAFVKEAIMYNPGYVVNPA